MRLDEVTPLLTAVATPRLSATLNAWRVGQILDAVVTRITNVGTATLNVNNISIDIHSQLPLAVGTRLVLEVAQTGPRIALRVLTTPAPKDAVAEALRVVAPQQGALGPVLTELARIAQPIATPALPLATAAPTATLAPSAGAATQTPASASATAAALAPQVAATLPASPASLAAALAAAPPALRELAKSVIERIRTPAQTASPEGLKQAVKNAGPFFEHQLATATSAADAALVFDHDLKAGLLRLVSYLKTTLPPAAPQGGTPATAPPPAPTAGPHDHTPAHAAPLAAALLTGNAAPLETLAKEADAALARITTQQLLSLPEHRADAPQWIFDLPLRSGERVDVFHLHVFREKHARDANHPPAWCVRLSFDLVTLGNVAALVTLFGGSVSVSIWTQQKTTARLFEEQLSTLRTELHTAGVPISRLHCECGDAPFSTDAPLKHKRSGLIDERA
jgi:hypothetical protein